MFLTYGKPVALEFYSGIVYGGKGRMMDTLERFYIFRETNQINDRLTIKPNRIFETIVQKDPQRGLPTSYKHLSNST